MSLPPPPPTTINPLTPPPPPPPNLPSLTLEKSLSLTTLHNASLAIDPSTGNIAHAAGACVIIYSPRRNRQVRFLRASKRISSLTYSPTGSHLAVGESGGRAPAVIVWDLTTGQVVAELKGHKHGVGCVAFSPNGQTLVSVGYKGDRRLYVWNWKAGRCVAAGRIASKVHDIAFLKPETSTSNPPGFVTVGARHVKYWSLAAQDVVFPGQGGAATDNTSLDDNLESLIGENVPAGSALPELKGYPASILEKFSNATFVSVASFGGRSYCVTETGALCVFDEVTRVMGSFLEVHMFDLPALEYKGSTPVFLGGKGVCATKWLPGGSKLSVVYEGGGMAVYDVGRVDGISCYRSMVGHEGGVFDCAMIESPPSPHSLPDGNSEGCPEGSFVTVGSDDCLRVWNLGVPGKAKVFDKRWKNLNCREMIRVKRRPNTINSNPDDPPPPHADDSSDDSIPLTERTALPTSTTFPRCVAAYKSHIALGCRNGDVCVYDLNSDKWVSEIAAHTKEVTSVAFNPKGVLASGSRDKLIHLFDGEKKYTQVGTLADHSGGVTRVKFSSDGERIISAAGDRNVLVRNHDGTDSKNIKVPKGTIYDVANDVSDKFLLVSGQDKKLNVYNANNGRNVRSYEVANAGGELYKIDVDPSGLFVVAASVDKWIRLFDFYSGDCIGKVAGHGEVITSVKFTLDGRRVVSTSADGTIFVWRLAPELTSAMLERRSELEARKIVEATATKNRVEEETKGREVQQQQQQQQLKVTEVPQWAKTVKGVKDVKDIKDAKVVVPKAAGAWGKKSNGNTPSTPSSLEELLPPPPPEVEETYEDDFEEDISPRLAPIAAVNDDLLSSSLSIVDLADGGDEDKDEDPSLFYTSVECDEGLKGMFEKKDVVDENVMVRKDDDVVEFGDVEDTADESMYKQFVDGISRHFMEEEGQGGELVRESISKDFMSELTLKQEREALKMTEKKKQTSDAVEKMREQLSEMGILAMGTMELNLRPTTARKEGREAVEDVMGGVLKEIENRRDEEGVEASPPPRGGEEENDVVETAEVETAEAETTEAVEESAVPPPLTVDLTVDTLAAVLSSQNNLFLSPATTNCSTDKSLLGLSFTHTGENDYVHVSPNQSTTSPASQPDKENESRENSVGGDDRGGLMKPTPSTSVATALALKRPKTEYKKTLTELNSAMDNAFKLYEELLEQSMAADQLDVGGESFDASTTFESCELLTSFRDSFAGLAGKMSVLNDKTNTSMMRGSFLGGMPSILEDSVGGRSVGGTSVGSGSVSKPPLVRPSTAPAQQLGDRSDADVLDSVLDKYSDILLARIEKKMMSKSGSSLTS